jgi:hypothetical protein
MRVISGVRRAPALAMATSDARAQSGAPMDLYMRALRQLYPPFPTAATLAHQSGEYGDVAAELGPKRLRFEKPNAAIRGSWSKLFRIAAALMAPLPPTAVYAQHASDDPLATANDVFGLTLGLESIGLYGPGLVRGFNPQTAGNVRIDGLYFDQPPGPRGFRRGSQRGRQPRNDFARPNQPMAKHCGGDCCQIVPSVRRIITLVRRGAEPEYSR